MANTDGMALALEEFARWADPGGSTRLVVLVDGAGGHIARRLAVPRVREAVANEGSDAPGAMEPALVERGRWLIDHPGLVRGAVGFNRAVALNG